MRSEAMLIVARRRSLKIIASFLPYEKFQACVDLRRYFPDYAEGVYLLNTGFLLQHVIRHVSPVEIYKPIREG